MVGSRSHADPFTSAVATELGIEEQVMSGSVGLKCGLIAEGHCDLYVHPVPYLGEWDTCAPEIILREAGGTVLSCAAEPLRYNKRVPRQPDGIAAIGGASPADAAHRIAELYAERVRLAASPRVRG
jgi:3'(2'), 5'-bisphosphate nucleotidase